MAAILANANRNPEENPEPFTVHDFVQWLEASFDEVDDAEEVEDDDADWDDATEDELDDQYGAEWPADEPELATDEEPAWMQWKRNIRAYAESVQSPTLSPPAQ